MSDEMTTWFDELNSINLNAAQEITSHAIEGFTIILPNEIENRLEHELTRMLDNPVFLELLSETSQNQTSHMEYNTDILKLCKLLFFKEVLVSHSI
jgi:hypothetical protein